MIWLYCVLAGLTVLAAHFWREDWLETHGRRSQRPARHAYSHWGNPPTYQASIARHRAH